MWLVTQENYSMKDCYQLLTATLKDSKWCKFWKLKVPPKISIYLWKFKHQISITRKFLQARSHVQALRSLCGWCNALEESIEHLIFDCKIAKWAWSFIANWWDIDTSNFDYRTLWSNIFINFKKSVVQDAWRMIIRDALFTLVNIACSQ